MPYTDQDTSDSLNIPGACFFELCLYIPYKMQCSYILGASLLLFDMSLMQERSHIFAGQSIVETSFFIHFQCIPL